MKCPADVYRPSTRAYQGLPALTYPFHDNTVHVTLSRLGRKLGEPPAIETITNVGIPHRGILLNSRGLESVFAATLGGAPSTHQYGPVIESRSPGV